VFRNEGICPCAGERPDPVDLSRVKLTELVHSAGCASKIAPADLDAVLSRLPEVNDPAVISGLAAGDDAAIYRLSETLHLVQTVDVFTPCVDDPALFGKICAANCLSDVYAMGGEPRTALSILCFPSETLDSEVMYQMLNGAMQVFAEAGVSLIGGHSLKDDEIKLGFAITGTIDPRVAASLERPRPGDWLVLTKPLGTGVLAFSHQIGRTHASGMAAGAAAMAALNRPAAEAMKTAGASACTDVTGFGLFGHLYRMLRGTALAAQVGADGLPALPGALEALQQDIIPGAIERNREYVNENLRVDGEVDEARINLGFDAQTSGGLLIAIPESRLRRLLAELEARGVTGQVIGRIVPRDGPHIILNRNLAGLEPAVLPTPPMSTHPSDHSTSATPLPSAGPCCCAPGGAAPPSGSTVDDTGAAFAALLRAAQAGGLLDARTKELILISLVIYSRCAPCFDAHYRKAMDLGISRGELDEAAWCAVLMGGAPVRLFYQECLKRIADKG
jgi:selenide,water dikinase